MGLDQGPVPRAQTPGTASGRSSADDQRLLLDPAHRGPVAGYPPGDVRPLVDGVRPLSQVEARRNLGPGAGTPGSAPRPERANRLGSLVRGRQHRPGLALCRGGRQKGGPGEPPDHALGRSRGGFGTKLHVVVCGHGTPLGAAVSPGQDHESRHLEEALDSVALPYAWTEPRFTPENLAGDKAYTGEPIRGMLEVLGVRPEIAHLSTETQKPWEIPFDRALYRRRNVVERVVG